MAKSTNDKTQQQQQGSEQSDQPRQHGQVHAPVQGGRDRGNRQGGDAPLEDAELGSDPQAGNPGAQQAAEIQQSAQRVGMGSHRHSGRGNEQALDADADVDDLGNRVKGAARSRADKGG
jgi:hypothetical protein